jgi:5-methylcytosine-specific restriction endonuclease McrA
MARQVSAEVKGERTKVILLRDLRRALRAAELKRCPRCRKIFGREAASAKATYCRPCQRATEKAWRLANPERSKLRNAARQARRKSDPIAVEKERARHRAREEKRRKFRFQLIARGEREQRQRVRSKDRLKLLMAHKFRCAICSILLVDGFDVDHIVPLCRGGKHRFDNFQLLCKPCHQKKGLQLREEMS